MKFWTFEKNLWSEFTSVEIMNYEVARKKEKAKQTSVREKIAHDYAYACLLKEKDRSNVILYNTNTTFDRLARMKPRDLNRSIAVVLFSIIRLLTKKSIKVFFFLHWTFPRGIHTGQNQFSTIIFWNTLLTINTMLTCLNPQVDAWSFSFDSLRPKVRNGKKIKNHWCNAYEAYIMNVSITVQGVAKVCRGDFPVGKIPRLWRGRSRCPGKTSILSSSRERTGRDQTRSICQDHWNKHSFI